MTRLFCEIISMKYVLVIMDGAADEPLDELGSLTAIEKAGIPHIDALSKKGQQGIVHTVPKGFSPGSDIAIMSIFSYDPTKYHTGRAPLEAAAQNIQTNPDEWIFRCNLITVANGDMQDHSAGHIDSVQGTQLINDIKNQLPSKEYTFYPGVSYRHILVYKGEFQLTTTPPHDFPGEPISKYMPKGKGAKQICDLMEKGEEILSQHEINKVRRDLGENPATNIWLWGQGKKPQMDDFRRKFGLSAALITAVDLVRGLGRLIGMTIQEVEGATGYLDTNYAGKGQAAIDLLEDKDLVVVHVEAPDEAGHGCLIDEKVKAIENIDEHVIGPIVKHLESQDEPWRIMVLPDHPTPCKKRVHTRDAVPFIVAGTDVNHSRHLEYSEKNSRETGLVIEKGHELMEYFLKG